MNVYLFCAFGSVQRSLWLLSRAQDHDEWDLGVSCYPGDKNWLHNLKNIHHHQSTHKFKFSSQWWKLIIIIIWYAKWCAVCDSVEYSQVVNAVMYCEALNISYLSKETRTFESECYPAVQNIGCDVLLHPPHCLIRINNCLGPSNDIYLGSCFRQMTLLLKRNNDSSIWLIARSLKWLIYRLWRRSIVVLIKYA